MAAKKAARKTAAKAAPKKASPKAASKPAPKAAAKAAPKPAPKAVPKAAHVPAPDAVLTGPPPGRNEPCYCGSGRKYKHCHLPLDDEKAAAARQKAAAETADQPVETAAPAPPFTPKHQTEQPWKAHTFRGFVPRARSPRKVGGA